MNYSPKHGIRQEISEICVNLVELCIGENFIFYAKTWKRLKIPTKIRAPYFFVRNFEEAYFGRFFWQKFLGTPQIDDKKIIEIPDFQKCAEKIEKLRIFKPPPEGTGLSEMVIFVKIWSNKPSCHQNIKKSSARNFWRLTGLFSYPRNFHFLRKSHIFEKIEKAPELPIKKSSKMCWKNWKIIHLQNAARRYRLVGNGHFCKNMTKQTSLPSKYKKKLSQKFLAPYRISVIVYKFSFLPKLWKIRWKAYIFKNL